MPERVFAPAHLSGQSGQRRQLLKLKQSNAPDPIKIINAGGPVPGNSRAAGNGVSR